MPITLHEDKLLIANQMVTEQQIADLVAKHLNVVGRTRTLEATAQQLVDADFPDDVLVSFVMAVCAVNSSCAVSIVNQTGNN